MDSPRDPADPQSPMPGGPEGPQAPPQGPQAPLPGGPPGQPWTPPPGPGGQVPPGGWGQPLPQAGIAPGQLAGWWPRAAAYLIDALIVGIPAALILGILFAFGVAVGDSEAGVVAAVLTFFLFLLVIAVVGLLYAPLLMRREGEHNGKTWGKQAMGIRVVRANGLPVDFGIAALREILLKGIGVGIASSFFFGIPALLNFLWPLWDDQNRALHDMAAQTRVVRA